MKLFKIRILSALQLESQTFSIASPRSLKKNIYIYTGRNFRNRRQNFKNIFYSSVRIKKSHMNVGPLSLYKLNNFYLPLSYDPRDYALKFWPLISETPCIIYIYNIDVYNVRFCSCVCRMSARILAPSGGWHFSLTVYNASIHAYIIYSVGRR